MIVDAMLKDADDKLLDEIDDALRRLKAVVDEVTRRRDAEVPPLLPELPSQ